MDIVVFHSIHCPDSRAFVSDPAVNLADNVEIIDWYGDTDRAQEWLTEHPTVGPTVFPTVWVWSPAYRRPDYMEIWHTPPRAAGTYEVWEEPAYSLEMKSTSSNIPAHWEFVPPGHEEWNDILSREQFYKDRAELNPPQA